MNNDEKNPFIKDDLFDRSVNVIELQKILRKGKMVMDDAEEISDQIDARIRPSVQVPFKLKGLLGVALGGMVGIWGVRSAWQAFYGYKSQQEMDLKAGTIPKTDLINQNFMLPKPASLVMDHIQTDNSYFFSMTNTDHDIVLENLLSKKFLRDMYYLLPNKKYYKNYISNVFQHAFLKLTPDPHNGNLDNRLFRSDLIKSFRYLSTFFLNGTMINSPGLCDLKEYSRGIYRLLKKEFGDQSEVYDIYQPYQVAKNLSNQALHASKFIDIDSLCVEIKAAVNNFIKEGSCKRFSSGAEIILNYARQAYSEIALLDRTNPLQKLIFKNILNKLNHINEEFYSKSGAPGSWGRFTLDSIQIFFTGSHKLLLRGTELYILLLIVNATIIPDFIGLLENAGCKSTDLSILNNLLLDLQKQKELDIRNFVPNSSMPNLKATEQVRILNVNHNRPNTSQTSPIYNDTNTLKATTRSKLSNTSPATPKYNHPSTSQTSPIYNDTNTLKATTRSKLSNTSPATPKYNHPSTSQASPKNDGANTLKATTRSKLSNTSQTTLKYNHPSTPQASPKDDSANILKTTTTRYNPSKNSQTAPKYNRPHIPLTSSTTEYEEQKSSNHKKSGADIFFKASTIPLPVIQVKGIPNDIIMAASVAVAHKAIFLGTGMLSQIETLRRLIANSPTDMLSVAPKQQVPQPPQQHVDYLNIPGPSRRNFEFPRIADELNLRITNSRSTFTEYVNGNFGRININRMGEYRNRYFRYKLDVYGIRFKEGYSVTEGLALNSATDLVNVRSAKMMVAEHLDFVNAAITKTLRLFDIILDQAAENQRSAGVIMEYLVDYFKKTLNIYDDNIITEVLFRLQEVASRSNKYLQTMARNRFKNIWFISTYGDVEQSARLGDFFTNLDSSRIRSLPMFTTVYAGEVDDTIIAMFPEAAHAVNPEHPIPDFRYDTHHVGESLIHEITHASSTTEDYMYFEATRNGRAKNAKDMMEEFYRNIKNNEISKDLRDAIHEYCKIYNKPIPSDLYAFFEENPRFKAYIIMNNAKSYETFFRDISEVFPYDIDSWSSTVYSIVSARDSLGQMEVLNGIESGSGIRSPALQ